MRLYRVDIDNPEEQENDPGEWFASKAKALRSYRRTVNGLKRSLREYADFTKRWHDDPDSVDLTAIPWWPGGILVTVSRVELADLPGRSLLIACLSRRRFAASIVDLDTFDVDDFADAAGIRQELSLID